MNTRSYWQRTVLAMAVTAAGLMTGIAPAVASQNETRLPTLRDDPDAAPWQEAEVPPPPAFNADKTVPFDVSRNSELQHGIDPATLSMGSDDVVRYVRIARSSQGAFNAVYEGIRCNSAEVRTYAHWNPASNSWKSNAQAPWRSLFNQPATLPAKALAQAGLCDGTTPNGKPEKMVRDLRYGKKP
ncbi:MAG TPA: CNP1-like family protein [Macromonas sp.]|nr:CNP1-like family protein [Macromonas sp.]